MNRNQCLSAVLVLSLAACGERSRTPQVVNDPNVPPSTPTITHAAPGFDAPAVASTKPIITPVVPVTNTPPPPLAPAPAPNPLSAKLGGEEGLHYLSFPELGAPTPGSHVDIVGVFAYGTTSDPALPAPQDEFVSMSLLQNMRVVDVRKPLNGAVEVGLSVTVDEVEMLLLSAARGTLVPLLRAPGDVEVSTLTKKTFREAVEDLEVMQEGRQLRRRSRPTVIGSGSIAPSERGLVLANRLPAGVLTVGSQVDVYVVFGVDGDEAATMTLLQDVDVVGVNATQMQLSVTLDEAEMLVLAERRGDLSVVLRNSTRSVSTISTKTMRMILEDLEVIQEKRMIRIRRKPKKKMASQTIEIIRGDGGGSMPHYAAYSAPGRSAPPTSESYQNPGQNGWVGTAEDALSTFAADVDAGSFTIARRKLNEGAMPPIDSVRPEEWVNYFTYNYPQPTNGPFGVSLEAAPSPFQTSANYRLLRVGIQAKTFAVAKRPPVHLTFLVDVSGSMRSDDKLGLAKTSLAVLVGALQPQDTVAITTYAGATETVLEPTSVAARGEILAAIQRLNSGGGTAMDDGLKAAYSLAESTFVVGHENRVLVLSDGDANVGRTGVDDMLATIERGAKRGITMSTIGFGMGNYKDAAMEQLANKGDGNYYYIDSMDEARRVFGEQLDATLRTVARDVKLQVEFDPAAVKRYRLIGYENRDIADRDFRNDSVDAGEMGAGHSVTALYELEMANPNAARVATVRVRHRSPDDTGPTLETTAVLRGADMAAKLADTSHAFRFAAAVAAFAEIVRQSPYAAHLNLEWVEEIASGALGTQADRPQLIELIGRAKSLRPGY